jgi:hypothetical protein
LNNILKIDVCQGLNLKQLTEKLSDGSLIGAGYSFKNPHWEITTKGSNGCSVSLLAEVNGAVTTTTSYFANLDDSHLYGNDRDSQFIMNNFANRPYTFTIP